MSRHAAYIASIVLTVLFLVLASRTPAGWWGVAVFGALAVLGTLDLLQRKSTLRRNYPLLAHFRYGLESIGPEMRQYFIQSDTAEVPFSRQQWALVQRHEFAGQPLQRVLLNQLRIGRADGWCQLQTIRARE